MDVIIKMMCISYNPKTLKMENVSYSTTIPTDIPIDTAVDIITHFISDELLWTENTGNRTKTNGKLVSITADVSGNMYCFSISGQPKKPDKEFDYNY